VTGGTGIFVGVYGTVRLSNVKFPTSLFYRFKLFGIPKLPAELIWDTVLPTENVKPSPSASLPGFALPNFTD
jgi:allene oxide cyclase